MMNQKLFRYTVLFSAIAMSSLSAHANDPFAELDAATSNNSSGSDPSGKSITKEQEFQKWLGKHQGEFNSYKEQLKKEFEAYKKIAREEQERFDKDLGKLWDKPETSSKKVWVDYSEDLTTKNKVDFEKKTISISTVVPKEKKVNDAELRAKLKTLVTKNKAEAFKDDKVAQAVERRTTKELQLVETAKVEPKPILLPLVTDEEKPSEKTVDTIVDGMLKEKKTKVETNKKGDTVVTIEVPIKEPPKAKVMADVKVNKLPRGAREIADDVNTFAEKSKLDQALVFAIIETESAFNPMAKSPIPAYGLMQIVPRSAGLDATAQLFGKGRVLTPSYLYTSDKNIEIGATYLNILLYRYLAGIKDPKSRLYCSIAAYNTGHGNVAKAFTGNLNFKKALPKINAMSSQEVYDHLIKNLPYEETQHYLRKVVSRIPKYAI